MADSPHARRCPVCGHASVRDGCPNRLCGRRDRAFSVVFSVGAHQGGLRRAVWRYKYRGERHLARVFSAMLGDFIAGHPVWFEEFDLLTAVPGYAGAGARRTWDPTALVLEGLARRLGPGWSVASGAVAKRFETPPMAGRSWAARRRLAQTQLRSALWVPCPSLVAGRQVLLVDDVLTDGSTLAEVARVLRRAGATDVAGLVLGRPVWAGREAGPPPGATATPPAEGRTTGHPGAGEPPPGR